MMRYLKVCLVSALAAAAFVLAIGGCHSDRMCDVVCEDRPAEIVIFDNPDDITLSTDPLVIKCIGITGDHLHLSVTYSGRCEEHGWSRVAKSF